MTLKNDENKSSKIAADDMLEIIFHDRIRFASLHSAAMSHELYTPLVIIRGLAESLLRKPNQDPQPHLREISSEAERLLKIIDAMVSLSPAEPLSLQKISLREMIDRVTIFFERECLEKGISIRIDVDEKINIESEPHRLKSILGALIQNAIEAFENKPAREVKSITIHAEEVAEGIHLTISDTGMGIPNEVQKKIAEQIFSNKKSFEIKSGLGLAMAHKMATDLGIKLGFVSEKSRGSSFTLTIKK
jgi:signal transduction histidine kinase